MYIYIHTYLITNNAVATPSNKKDLIFTDDNAMRQCLVKDKFKKNIDKLKKYIMNDTLLFVKFGTDSL